MFIVWALFPRVSVHKLCNNHFKLGNTLFFFFAFFLLFLEIKNASPLSGAAVQNCCPKRKPRTVGQDHIFYFLLGPNWTVKKCSIFWTNLVNPPTSSCFLFIYLFFKSILKYFI
jgi:hypothetical protein